LLQQQLSLPITMIRTRRLAIAAGLALLETAAAGAQWQPLVTGTTASLRGLSVVSDDVVWASGSRGTVLHTLDGGNTWVVDSIPGAARFDVRAIHAQNALVAHAAATSGRIWRTTDGGRTWALMYEAVDSSVFLDAIEFFDDQHGLALGDPISGRFLLLVTDDGGTTWREAVEASRPIARPGEAAFAASGTSVASWGGRLALIGSGGSVARVFRTTDVGQHWTEVSTSMASGSPSQGIFSVALADSLWGVAVGGDYQHPDSVRGNAVLTQDGGRSWRSADSPPHGYRSGVAAMRRGGNVVAIAVGTTGTDLSIDGGRTWRALDSAAFNAVRFTPGGAAIAVGPRGAAARLPAPDRAPPPRPHR
jgi:photosystem II stability/assembly factor-like uncharacterized protein